MKLVEYSSGQNSEIQYNNDGQIINVEVNTLLGESYSLNYEDGMLKRLTHIENRLLIVDREYFYNENILYKSIDNGESYFNPEDRITYYFFDSDSRLVQQLDSINNWGTNENEWQIFTKSYNYDSRGNMDYMVQLGSTGDSISEIRYKYDNKRNPLQGKYFNIIHGVDIEFNLITSPSNITQRQTSKRILGTSIFAYDNDGYPVQTYPSHDISIRVDYVYQKLGE